MEVEQPLCENSPRNDATKQNEPHERPPFLHVVDHRRLIDEQPSGCKNAECRRGFHRPVDEGRSSRCSVSNFRRSNWVTASRAANTFTPVFATDSKRGTRLFLL